MTTYKLPTVVSLFARPWLFSLLFLVSLFIAAPLKAEPVSKSFFGDVAIGGHDTVAYHTLPKNAVSVAISGKERFLVKWKGANWYFASQSDADKFRADPEKYSPAYNGHCANALSLGEGLIKTDGTVWAIFENQLYLFYADRGRQRWLNGNWLAYKIEADQAWYALSR